MSHSWKCFHLKNLSEIKPSALITPCYSITPWTVRGSSCRHKSIENPKNTPNNRPYDDSPLIQSSHTMPASTVAAVTNGQVMEQIGAATELWCPSTGKHSTASEVLANKVVSGRTTMADSLPFAFHKSSTHSICIIIVWFSVCLWRSSSILVHIGVHVS